ncbi:MAG: glycosyltransferase family 2 protein [Gemmatimonadaceae bacterium]|nr:glycosyltransferase family 2 protein [Gemmatimonadaceae bacterium]MDQ3244028.1 glycosyltransferase family 2 protein [Gemmatimonadota bacterium]
MTSLVSVVIPHFDRSELLALAVASVMSSSEKEFDVVIVDDGSSADEWRQVQSLGNERVSVIRRSDGHKGPSRCRNLGVAASRASYIVFLDSDDIMAPWCLETRLRTAMEEPAADCWVFPVLLFRDSPGDQRFLWNKMKNGIDDAARFASSDPPWHTSSPLWKKSSLLGFGGFNEEVIYGDDSDMHLRALLSGIAARQYPESLPDVFVRRSEAPRITNSLSPALVESRRVRLREGTRFLKDTPTASGLLRCWEAQYFAEAEFLLFNHREATEPVGKVLDAWESEFSPAVSLRRTVRAYFAAALACRRRAYLMVRIARRIVMRLVPPAFFSFGGEVTPVMATEPAILEVRKRMHFETGKP